MNKPFRYTFEMAPVFGTIEKALLKKMRDVIGFKGGDGLLFPGMHVNNSLLIELKN